MDDDATQRRRDAAAGDSAPPERASTADELRPTLLDATGHLLVEVLSGYLDEPDSFVAADRSVVEAHLARCDSCQTTLVELRQIVNALAALPQPTLPRSFALTPAQARQRTPAVVAESRWWQRVEWSAQLGKLRWATAVAALLFILVLGVDLLGAGSNAPNSVAGRTEAIARDATGSGALAAATAATTGDAAVTSANQRAALPQATTAAGAAMPTTAAAASAASPTAATGSAAADTAASPESSESYALKSAPEATASSVAAPQPAAPSLPPAVPAAPTDSHNPWRVAETGLALLTAWLLAAMLAIPLLVRRDAGRDS